MKKSLLALAILGAFAGAASAQTNVTVYGVVDAGIVSFDDDVDRTTRLDSGNQSGSRIGFRGSEDLGGGLSAIFTLENGFNVDDGTLGQGNRLFGRQAFVGLNGGFGSVKLGRQYTPMRLAVESIDPFSLGLAGNAENVFNTYGSRTDNTLNYTAPNFGGFTGQLAYSFGEASGSTSLGRHLGASVGYANGPINVVLVYHRQNLTATAGTPAVTVDAGDADTWMLGGTYNFGIAKVHAAYARNDAETAAGVTTVDGDNILLGASATFGAGTVMASWIRRTDDVTGAGGASRDADLFAIGYTHALSKRTNLYTSYGQVRNDAGANVSFQGTNSAYAIPVAGAGRDPSIFNIGVRHRF